MPFMITFHDVPGTDRDKKAGIRAVHIDHVMRNADRIIASGGLFPDDDDFPNGGMIVLAVETREEAVAYIESDPFFLSGIFTTYEIHRFKKFIFDHKRVT